MSWLVPEPSCKGFPAVHPFFVLQTDGLPELYEKANYTCVDGLDVVGTPVAECVLGHWKGSFSCTGMFALLSLSISSAWPSSCL